MEIRLSPKFREYAEEERIRFVVLFGSVAKGVHHEESDFDIAVLFRDPEKFSGKYNETLFALADAMGVPAEKIDLTNLGADNILLRYQVTSDGKLLFGDRTEYAQYCGFAYRDYMDARSLFDLERAMIEKRQEHFKQFLTVR